METKYTLSPKELQALLKKLSTAIVAVQKAVDKRAAQDLERLTSQTDEALSAIRDTEKRLIALTNETKTVSQSEVRTLTRQLNDEIAAVKALIPTIDLTPVERRIDEAMAVIEAKIPNLPEELSAEGIRDKLEALEGDERLDASAIKGLAEQLKTLNKNVAKIMSGGGGQLDVSHWPRHEEFTMNGSDTTVTLAQAVGAGGNAIFAVRLQGQVLDMTTHYTVSGNKITLVDITPPNGTIISITYMP